MIILPDRRLSRGKLLMPIPKWQWREPSVALARDQFNNKVVRTFFRLTARLADGHIVWHGQFDDRDDADAFLFALASGSLRYERDLWRLPTPEWHPGLSDELFYKIAVTSFLTGTGASQTYNVPADWNNSNNVIHCIGGGGSGGSRRSDLTNACNSSGGGGGGYGKYTNLTLTAGGTATYGITDGGAAVTRTSNGSTAGNAGGQSYFGAATYAGASVGGDAGAAGNAAAATLSAASGGAGKGTASFTGGSGGANNSTSTARRATGGGGAAGPNGNGNNGVTTSSSTSVGTNGGSGDAGSGGAAGAGGNGSGGAGGDGTEFQVSPNYGSGGGGGGREASSSTTITAGSGGAYGAGGGGISVSGTGGATSGAGRDGLIVVEYTPVTNSLANNNLPMLGM